MQLIPFNYNDASMLCNSLQHLVGYTFDVNIPSISNIECVAVAPFDQINKKNFMFFYLLSGNAHKALHEEYKGLLYDVIVIAHSLEDENELFFYDIHTWLYKNNFTMNDVLSDASKLKFT